MLISTQLKMLLKAKFELNWEDAKDCQKFGLESAHQRTYKSCDLGVV